MSLVPLTLRNETAKAFRRFRDRMSQGCKRYTKKIGWQGGYATHTLFWNPREKIWSVFDPKEARGRYWCAFGTQNPKSRHMLNIVMECNPPLEGLNRRCAGAFLTDGRKVFIAHSGKIGGGRKGVGKSVFVDRYPHGNWQNVLWSPKAQREMVVIGEIGHKHLPLQFADVVRQVEKIKKTAAGKTTRTPKETPKSFFSPEFSGRRRGYRISSDIVSSCDHGPVVTSLNAHLVECGFKQIGNDKERDLYILSKGGQIGVLFEVKTDLSTSSLYKGIGQLVFHGYRNAKLPRRILVLPGVPPHKVQQVLTRSGIAVLTYSWENGKAVFPDLHTILS